VADYRQFCRECGNEIGFGSHKKDCESLRRVREAEAERRRFDDEWRAAVRELSEDDKLSALLELHRRSIALHQELAAVDRKLDAVKGALRGESGGHEVLQRYSEAVREL
jgi:hypothetical protein